VKRVEVFSDPPSLGNATRFVLIHFPPLSSVSTYVPMDPSKPCAMYEMSARGSLQLALSGCQLMRESQNHADMYITGPEKFSQSMMMVQ